MNFFNQISAVLLCDFYKFGHKFQYPKGLEYVYSTWIPRCSRLPFANEVVAFGFQGFIKNYLIEIFNFNFFGRPKAQAIWEYKRYVQYALGDSEPDVRHIEELHDLGYLPLHIKAVPEGTLIPLRVPMLTIENTHPNFGWLTNFIETIASCELWQAPTSATIAKAYKDILNQYADETTDGGRNFVPYQGHDFSMRGMGSLGSACISGAGHLLPFVGSDSVPAIAWLEYFYNANIEKELVGCSVNATEHSVMCAGGVNDEFETYRRLIEDIYPSGIVSIVSDTWDLWHVITDTLPKLKDSIMARDGKVVIRPDSGDPVDIICGTVDWTCTINEETPSEKGVIELLWDIFGGTINSKGYKELDPHIGAIYGDSITVDRAAEICKRLKDKGFASTNIVFGIGSYTYQYNTRDTFGFAMKATHCIINGKEINIFKDPATDVGGVKKSLTGKCVVLETTNGIMVKDALSAAEEEYISATGNNLLRTIFLNGNLIVDDTLAAIRARLNN